MAKTIRNQFHPDVVPPPGDTIKESLEALGMKQAEFAKRMGVSEKYVIDLLCGDAPLSADTALKLERVFNVPARFWTNLELGYREYLTRQNETKQLTASVGWARRFPIKELAALGWVERAPDELTNAHRLLTYFGCASEAQWRDLWERADAVFRHSAAQESDWHAVAAWLRRGQMEAQEMDLPEHNTDAWGKALTTIRANISPDPKVFQKLMVAECATAGVGLRFLPALPNMAVSGACIWHNQNPWIYLSLRYKTDDHLWFSFFHEAMHVWQNVRKRLFVDEPRQAVNDAKEIEANEYAAETLIPSAAYRDFVATARFDVLSVRAFAEEQKVTPGVVVGRLQHDRHVPWASSLNRLKLHYVWTTA
jgi:addiction module HigA family antidote